MMDLDFVVVLKIKIDDEKSFVARKSELESFFKLCWKKTRFEACFKFIK